MERKHSSLITIRAASDGRGREGTLGSAIFPRRQLGRAVSLPAEMALLAAGCLVRPGPWLPERGPKCGGASRRRCRFGRQRLELLAQYGLLGRKP